MAEYIPAIAVYLCAALTIYLLCEELMAYRVAAFLVALLWLPLLAVALIFKFAAMLRGGDADG